MRHSYSKSLCLLAVLSLLVVTLGLVSFCQAAQQPKPSTGQEAPFLNPKASAPAEQQAAQGIINEFFSKPYFHDYGLFVGNLESVDFEKDGAQGTLKGWPHITLLYKDKQLFEERDVPGGPPSVRRLIAVDPVYEEEWPETYLWYGDIDLDGESDYFVLDKPAMGSGPNGHYLVDWDRKAKDGSPLFIPFSQEQLGFPPDEDNRWMLFHNGQVPQPGFLPGEKILHFSRWHGPFHDGERWCFDGTHYFMCARLDVSYNPSANNMFELARLERFDAQGHSIGVSCHAYGDIFGEKGLFFAAQETIDLYDQPDEMDTPKGKLHKGQVATVLDVQSIEDASGDIIWYKLGLPNSTTAPAWAALYVEDTKNFPVPLLGVRNGPNGAEAKVLSRGKPLVVDSRPLAVREYYMH